MSFKKKVSLDKKKKHTHQLNIFNIF